MPTEGFEVGEDLFRDLEIPAEDGEEESYSFRSTLQPPKTHAQAKKIKADPDLLKGFADELPDPLRAKVLEAMRGKDIPDVKDLLKVIQANAVYVESIVEAGATPPLSKTEAWTRRGEDLESGMAFAVEMLAASEAVQKELGTQESISMGGYLSLLASYMMDFRVSLYALMADDGEISAALTKVSRENTIAQMNAYMDETLKAREESRAAADQSKKTKGIVGWILAAIAAIAFVVVGIATFGATFTLSPLVAVGIASMGAGMAFAGANLIAESFGKSSVGSLVAKAMQDSGMSDEMYVIISSIVMAYAVVLAIVSMGTMSGIAAGFGATAMTQASMALTLQVAVGVGSTVGTLGMSVISEAFMDSVTKSLKERFISQGATEKEAQERASKIAQALMWTFTVMIIVSSFSFQAGSGIKSLATKLFPAAGKAAAVVPGVVAPAAQVVQGVAQGAADAAQAGGEIVQDAVQAAANTAAQVGKKTGIEAGVFSWEALRRKMVAAVKDIGLQGGFKILEFGGKVAEASVAFVQFKYLMKQASAVMAQAEYEEIVTICKALQKLLDSAIQGLISNQASIADQAASMESVFVKIVAILSQALTAVTTGSYAGLSTTISSAIRKEEQEQLMVQSAVMAGVPGAGATVKKDEETKVKTKEELEKLAAISGVPGVATVTTTSAVSATTPGVASRMLSTTPEVKQQLALTQFMAVLSQKIADMFVAWGWDKRFSAKAAREITPALLKGLLGRGSKAVAVKNGTEALEEPTLGLIGQLMGEGESFAFSGEGTPPQIESFMEGDPALLALMNQLRDLQSLKNATPQQFAMIMASITQGLFGLRKGDKRGESDQINDMSSFIDLIMGASGMDQLVLALDLNSAEELGPVLQRLIEGDESGDLHRLYSPA
jgi:hypothetical protein